MSIKKEKNEDTKNAKPKEEFKREQQSKRINNWEEKRMYG